MAKLIQASEVEAAIRAFFTEEEVADIQYNIDAREESILDEIADWGSTEITSLTWYEAFTDYMDSAESWAAEDPEAKKTAKRCLEFLTIIGVYQPVTDEEYQSSSVSPASAKNLAYPKVKGIRYEFVSHVK